MSNARQLSTGEEERLAACEEVIQKGLRTFFEVGRALAEIRDKKLYRQEFKTFQKYCQERWQISPSYAHRVIEGAGVVQNLLPIGNIPTHESQVRPLTKLAPDQQREAWETAVQASKSGQPTAHELAHAASVVQQTKGGVSITAEIPADDQLPQDDGCRKFSAKEKEAIFKIERICGVDIYRSLEDGTLDRISGHTLVRWAQEQDEEVIKGVFGFMIDNRDWPFNKALQYVKEKVARDRLPEEIKRQRQELRGQVIESCPKLLETFDGCESIEAQCDLVARVNGFLSELASKVKPAVQLSLDENDAAPPDWTQEVEHAIERIGKECGAQFAQALRDHPIPDIFRFNELTPKTMRDCAPHIINEDCTVAEAIEHEKNKVNKTFASLTKQKSRDARR